MSRPESNLRDDLEEAWSGFVAAARRERERSDATAEDDFPHFSEDGRWRSLAVAHTSRWEGDFYDHGNWTAGFWFGVMWLLASDGDPRAADLAGKRLDGLAARADDATTHDLGFLFYPSLVLGSQLGYLTDDETTPALRAAETTARRFNARADFIQAFGPIGDARSAGTSTIDTMMNLPLLWWAAARGADHRLFDVARRHARTSARLFLRDDGSTYHLNEYDPISGALLQRGTYQGADEASCWSRGQAWAAAGFAWAFAATKEIEFLETAERTDAYYRARLSHDGIPPWDFSDESPAAPRDASSSAIAALGELVLGRVHPDESARAGHARNGRELLAKLSASSLNRDRDVDGILLHSCYSKPHGLGLDGATAWGDFYLGLALALATGRIELETALGFPPGR